MRHFQALVRFDTSDPPGNEKPAADYLREVLEKEGIAVQTFALEAQPAERGSSPKGNGSKRPLLLMGHTDVVNVDAAKWTHPPFSAARADGYVYGRGTLDDKDNVVASLMVMLTLKRLNVPLDRDVIFLAGVGRGGFDPRRHPVHGQSSTSRASMPSTCLAEGGGVTRSAGQGSVRRRCRRMKRYRGPSQLTARGVSGHGSIPLESKSLAPPGRCAREGWRWRPEIRLNETTRAYFTRLAEISTGAEAAAIPRRPRPQEGCGDRRTFPCPRTRESRVAPCDGDSDHPRRRIPRQRHPIRGEGDSSTFGRFRTTTLTTSSSRSARR